MINNDAVILNKITTDDWVLYQQIYTDDKLMKFVAPTLSSEKAQQSFASTLKKMSQMPPALLLYVIFSQMHQCKVGVIGLKWNQKSHKQAEIGIIVLAKYQRQGLAHQAKSLLIAHAFQELKLDSILAICDKNNIAANSANQKLGFTLCNQINTQNTEKILWKINK
jgi:diamine N-acetyltransferase